MACLQKPVSNDDCPENQSCIHFQLCQKYKYSEKSQIHFEVSRHTMIECRYERECKSFQRLIQGGYRLDDRGHCAIYSHPSRRDNAHVEKSVGSKKFITGQLEISTHENKYLSYDKLSIVGEELEKYLIEELENNGFGGVMKIPFESKTLWDIADEKMNHPRHIEMGKPLSRVEILAILLYTGTDAYSSLRKTETMHYAQSEDILHKKSWTAGMNPLKEENQKWIYFSEILSNAIKVLNVNDVKKRPDVTYHGLHEVEVDPDSFFSYWVTVDRIFFTHQRRVPDSFKYGTFVSTSTRRKIALNFMKSKDKVANGCLIELEIRDSCNGADVSWISKYSGECEFLINKGSEFYLKSLEFDTFENIQIAKII